MLESVFNKSAGLQVYNFIKDSLQMVYFCKYCEIFKNTYFEEHLRTTAFLSFAFPNTSPETHYKPSLYKK